MTTTKQKLEFVHAMARSTRATVRQCEALLRYAGTLARLQEDDLQRSRLEMLGREPKRDRIRRKVEELCGEIRGGEIFSLRYHLESIRTNLTGRDYPQERWARSLQYANEALTENYSDSALGEPCLPVFAGAALKIRVPGGEEIVCPS